MPFSSRFQTTTAASLIVLLSASTHLASARADNEITISVAKIAEYRNLELIQDPKPKYPPSPGSLSVTLRFSGEGITNATRMGFLKWSSVKDDTGKALGRGSGSSLSTTRMTVMRRQNLNNSRNLPENQYDVNLTFPRPERSAKAIQEMKGELKIRIAKTKSILVPFETLQSLVGKDLEDETLKKLGLAVRVEQFSSKSSTSARMKVTGDKRSTFLEAQIVDDKGKRVDSSSYSFDFRQYASVSVTAFNKLPKGSQVKFVIETEFKDIPVQIDLKDIPLP